MITKDTIEDFKAFMAGPIATLIKDYEAWRWKQLMETVGLRSNSLDALIVAQFEKGAASERQDGTLPAVLVWLETECRKQKEKEDKRKVGN